MSIENITNYIRISDRLASSGQPEEHEFKFIAKAGYEVVMNLAMPNSDNAIPEEGYLVSALKMSYVHIPVPFEAPTVEHLKQFIRVMQAFENKRVWVHCTVNYRVSAFMYQYYRLLLNKSEAEAKSVMWPDWHPNNIWQDFMKIML